MDDVKKLLDYVIQNLSHQLKTIALGDEFYYQSLTLATIDAVYSAQATYPSVQNVIERYCSKYRLTKIRSPRDHIPYLENQESVNALILKIEEVGCSYFAEHTFNNRSKTARRLKSEILLELLKTIRLLNIETFQDIQPWLTDTNQQQKLVSAISEIHGIGEATSRYFLMLAGDDQMVKPDRMIQRFIKNALGKSVHEAEAVSLIQAVSQQLLPQYPKLNPRFLDYIIWSWQRDSTGSNIRPTPHQSKSEVRANKLQQSKKDLPTSSTESMTIPQKTQQAMHKRYKPGHLLTSSEIKNDVVSDYGMPRSSVMPSDYCCNISNEDPKSGIYHIFFFDEDLKKYRLLPKLDITKPRERGKFSQ